MSRAGIYDEGEIFNRAQMKTCQRELYIKLAFYLASFFLYLYKYGRACILAHSSTH